MIFSMSLRASVFIIIVIIMRKLLQNKLPKKTFLALWLIAWIRLMVPYSWSSKWSIMNLVSLYTKHIRPAYMNAFGLTRKAAVTPVTIENYYELAVKSAKNSNTTVIPSMGEIIWTIGVVITAIYFIYKYIKALEVYREALPLDTQFFIKWREKHCLNRNYEIKESDQISSPLTYGFINPVILVPKSILITDMENMEYILLHEWNHIRRWDTLRKLILVITPCIHWFNPLVWIMFTLVNRDIELCCDEDVVRMIGEGNKKEYANLLVNMEKKRIKPNPLSLGFRSNYMKERIVSIMKIKKTSTSMILLAVILVIGATTVFATNGLTETPLAVEEANINSDSMNEKWDVFDVSTFDLCGRDYEEACSMLMELGLSFVIEE